jgi:hypothetical protein
METYIWIIIGVIAAAVVGVCLYFFVLHQDITSITIDIPSPTRPGSQVTIHISGTPNTKGTVLAYSIDSENFSTIATMNSNDKSYPWTIPTTVYTNTLIFSATLGSKTVLTEPFAVTPTFNLRTLQNSFIAPGVLPILFDTELTGLKNFILSTSTDGLNYSDVPSTSPYVLDTKIADRINWTINQPYSNIYVRLSTSGLKPIDLVSTCTNTIDISYIGSESRFTNATVYSDLNAAVMLGSVSSVIFGYIGYNQKVYLNYTTNANLLLADVIVSYQSYASLVDDNNWRTITVTPETNPLYPNYCSFNVYYNPSQPTFLPTTQVTNKLAIRIQDNSNRDATILPSITIPSINISVFMQNPSPVQYTFVVGKTSLATYSVTFKNATITSAKTWTVTASNSNNPFDFVTIVTTPVTSAGQVRFSLSGSQAASVTPVHNTLTFQSTNYDSDLLKSPPMLVTGW